MKTHLNIRTLAFVLLCFSVSDAQSSSVSRNVFQALDNLSSFGLRRVIYPQPSLMNGVPLKKYEPPVADMLSRDWDLNRVISTSKDIAVVRLIGQATDPVNEDVVQAIVAGLSPTFSPIPQNTAIFQALQNTTGIHFKSVAEKRSLLRFLSFSQVFCNQTIIFLSQLTQDSKTQLAMEDMLSSLEAPYNFLFMDEGKKLSREKMDQAIGIEKNPFLAIYRSGKPVFFDYFEMSTREIPGNDLFLSHMIDRFFSQNQDRILESFPRMEHVYKQGDVSSDGDTTVTGDTYSYSKFQAKNMSGYTLPVEENHKDKWRLMFESADGSFFLDHASRCPKD